MESFLAALKKMETHKSYFVALKVVRNDNKKLSNYYYFWKPIGTFYKIAQLLMSK
jgi:hypothetical protein